MAHHYLNRCVSTPPFSTLAQTLERYSTYYFFYCLATFPHFHQEYIQKYFLTVCLFRWLGEASTVGSLWQIMNNLPPPSKFFGTAKQRRACLGGRKVEGFSLFRRGIRPEWEDQMNAGGGEWCAKCTDLATVDGWWQNAILALVGESLGECSEGVTGVRMVDKSDGKQGHVGYRIEVWYDKTADATAIHDKLTEVICEGITADKPKFQKKAHPAVVSKAPAQKGGKGGAAGVAAPRPEPGSAAANQEALDEQRKVWQRQVRSIMAKITPEKAARLAPQLAALIQGVTPAAEGVDFAAQLIHKNALHEGLFAETYSVSVSSSTTLRPSVRRL